MTVFDFKTKWVLTNQEIADALNYQEWAVRSWFFTGKNQRNPHPVVSLTCELLDAKWLLEGKIPPTTNTNKAPVHKYAISHK